MPDRTMVNTQSIPHGPLGMIEGKCLYGARHEQSEFSPFRKVKSFPMQVPLICIFYKIVDDWH